MHHHSGGELKKKLLLAAIPLALLVSSCSQSHEAATNESAIDSKPTATRYTSVVELRDAYVSAGGECSEFKQTNKVKYAAESAECGDSAVLSTYLSEGAVQKQMESTKQALANIDSDTWLVGDNWIVNSPEIDKIQAQLGGNKISWGDTTELSTNERLFRSYLLEDEEGFTESDVRPALEIAHRSCEIYDGGEHADVLDYLIPQTDTRFSATQLGAILGIGVESLCPEHSGRIPES